MAEGVATEFVSHVVRHALIRVTIDWTVENGIHTLVASAIIGRRAGRPVLAARCVFSRGAAATRRFWAPS